MCPSTWAKQARTADWLRPPPAIDAEDADEPPDGTDVE
jgi:hypothetical protein